MTRQELENKLDSSVREYRANPNTETGHKLFGVAYGWLGLNPRDVSCYGPVLALFTTGLRHQPFHRYLRIRISVLLLTLALHKTRPGWNDHYLLIWQLTGEESALQEIHRRAQHETNGDMSMVVETCQWVVGSYRGQNAEFDQAMSAVEFGCCGIRTRSR